MKTKHLKSTRNCETTNSDVQPHKKKGSEIDQQNHIENVAVDENDDMEILIINV